ncbi:hypothetical protein [Rouxiella sp. WC2420]|uniref:Uncharacterized protein n=1 Tax=Rouxiella sp. WC2420 TaxID=3234145 RepID=A0AB39VSC1_9GAMM
MKPLIASLSLRSAILLTKIEENPTTKNVNKFIKNVCAVKNNNRCLFSKKNNNNSFDYSKIHSDLLELKHCQANFSEKKYTLINQAIAKNLNRIINRKLDFKPLYHSDLSVGSNSFSEYLNQQKIDPANQKMKIPYSTSTLTKKLFKAAFGTDSNLQSSFKLIEKHGRSTEYYDSISIPETQSTRIEDSPRMQYAAARNENLKKHLGVTFYDQEGNCYTHF